MNSGVSYVQEMLWHWLAWNREKKQLSKQQGVPVPELTRH